MVARCNKAKPRFRDLCSWEQYTIFCKIRHRVSSSEYKIYLNTCDSPVSPSTTLSSCSSQKCCNAGQHSQKHRQSDHFSISYPSPDRRCWQQTRLIRIWVDLHSWTDDVRRCADMDSSIPLRISFSLTVCHWSRIKIGCGSSQCICESLKILVRTVERYLRSGSSWVIKVGQRGWLIPTQVHFLAGMKALFGCDWRSKTRNEVHAVHNKHSNGDVCKWPRIESWVPYEWLTAPWWRHEDLATSGP